MLNSKFSELSLNRKEGI